MRFLLQRSVSSFLPFLSAALTLLKSLKSISLDAGFNGAGVGSACEPSWDCPFNYTYADNIILCVINGVRPMA